MTEFSMDQIAIVYEDESLLIVNKPAGLPTQATVDRRRPCLYNILLNSKKWSYLGLHHRLDMPTSGLVLLSKQKSANKAIAELFKERQIEKTYRALALGKILQNKFEIECYLKERKSKTGKTLMEVVNAGGDYSKTEFDCLKKGKNYSLIECRPHTGRMHQIRIHLKTLGFPICGDALYGKPDPRFPRLMLHAYQLAFPHPVRRILTTVVAPEPRDFVQVQNLIQEI